jgi:hypothetical protein
MLLKFVELIWDFLHATSWWRFSKKKKNWSRKNRTQWQSKVLIILLNIIASSFEFIYIKINAVSTYIHDIYVSNGWWPAQDIFNVRSFSGLIISFLSKSKVSPSKIKIYIEATICNFILRELQFQASTVVISKCLPFPVHLRLLFFFYLNRVSLTSL